MPDIGISDRPMPHHPMHGDWHDAFAALPLEAPPFDGWKALSRRLHVRSRRWPAWLAIAAALALAVGMPLRWASLQDDHEPVAASIPYEDTTPASPGTTKHPPILAAAEDAPVKEPATAPTTAAGTRTDHPRTTPLTAVKPSTALAVTPTTSETATPTAADTSAPSELDRLYAESARLEALLTIARDERVSSASAAVLGDHYDAQVSAIDTALMQSDLDDRQRIRLWHERVAALRQLAGFESTQRLLAAYGQRDDSRLVSID